MFGRGALLAPFLVFTAVQFLFYCVSRYTIFDKNTLTANHLLFNISIPNNAKKQNYWRKWLRLKNGAYYQLICLIRTE